jgi:tetratricopeptide (TPR) repeat protein
MNRPPAIPPLLRSIALGLILASVSAPSLRAQNPPETEPATLTPYQTALLNYKTGNYDAALAAIDAAEKSKPDDYATEMLKARILTEQKNFADGEKILRHYLTPNGPLEVELALADLLLRKRDFDGATQYDELALQAKPNDPDITLKLIYARIGAADLITASKYASQLKPLDPDHPCYYFASAALAQVTGKDQEAEDDIQTARTIYGITVSNRYLKTYLEVVVPVRENGSAPSPPPPLPTNAAPSSPNP